MTVNMADIYGQASDAWSTLQPTSATGPNQGSVAPPSRSAPGGAATNGSPVTLVFVGFILLLIAWRLLIEFAAK